MYKQRNLKVYLMKKEATKANKIIPLIIYFFIKEVLRTKRRRLERVGRIRVLPD